MKIRLFISACAAFLIAGCGGGGGGNDEYLLRGNVSGLVGSVTLQNNGGATVTLSAAGSFAFHDRLPEGAAYRVTVSAQPQGQTCVVAQGEGMVSASMPQIAVTCAAVPLTLTGSTPAAGTTGVEPGATATLNFSSALASSPPASSVVSLRLGSRDHVFVASYSGNQLVVAPALPLVLAANYSLEVSTGIRGVGGGQMAAPLSLGFTTRDGLWHPSSVIVSNTTPSFADRAIESPRAVVDAAGNTLVIWLQRGGTGLDVWSNRYVPGAGWGAAARIELENTGNAANPQVAIDAAGNAIAVWQQFNGGYLDLWANRFTPSGGWGTAQLIESSDNTTGSTDQARLSMNARGDAVVVWRQHDGHLDDDIWANRYVVGSGWATPTRIELVPGDAGTPAVHLADNGEAFAVWEHTDGAVVSLRCTRFLPDAGWQIPDSIENTTTWTRFPEIVVDAAGNATVAWAQQQTLSSQFDLWANRYVAGTGWLGAAPIESGSSVNSREHKLAVDAQGNVLVVFSGLQASSASIWASRYTAAGVWQTAAAIENSVDIETQPQLGMDAAGNAIAVWQHAGNPAPSGTLNIRASRFLGSWMPHVDLGPDVSAGTVSSPVIAVGRGGVAHVFWVQSGGTTMREDDLTEARFD